MTAPDRDGADGASDPSSRGGGGSSDASDPAGTGRGVTVSRRGVLRGGAGVLAAGVLGADAGAAASHGFDRDSVTWTAQSRRLEGVPSPYLDGESGRGALTAAMSTNTQLQYLGAQWQPFGNPNRNADADGCWQHTFMLSSYALSLKPYVLHYDQPLDGVDYVPAMPREDLPDEVLDILDDRYEEPDEFNEYTYGKAEFDTSAEFEIKTLAGELDVDLPGGQGELTVLDDVAISVRRDSNLLGFPDPEDFTSKVFRRGLTGDEVAATEGLATLNAHTVDPSDAGFRDVREHKPNGRIARIQDVQNRRGQRNALWQDSLGLGMGVASAGLPLLVGGGIVSAPMASAIGGTLTLTSLTLGSFKWASSLVDLLGPPPADAPPYKGVYQEYPYPDRETFPTAGCFAMFDVYVGADADLDVLEHPPQFSVRVKHTSSDVSSADTLTHAPIWVVTFEDVPSGPDAISEPWEAYTATVRRPSDAESHLENEVTDDHHIRYVNGSGSPVTFRPEPTFSVEPEVATAGEEVTFDASGTLVGGAPIERHEWTLFELSRSDDDEEGRRDLERSRVPLDDDARSGGDIFDSPDAGTFATTLYRPGYYEMKLTVHDAHHDDGYSVRKLFRVEEGSPGDVSVELDAYPETGPVGEPFTFEASASAGDDEDGGIPLPGIDLPRFAFEWATLRKLPASSPIQPPGDRDPQFEEADDWADNTNERSFDEAADYAVFVRATDVLTGASGTASVTVTVTEDGDSVAGDRSFYDDFEDGDYSADPKWRTRDLGGTDVAEVVEYPQREPSGGRHALQLRGRSSGAEVYWATPQPGWSEPWRLHGLFSLVESPADGGVLHSMDVAFNDLRFKHYGEFVQLEVLGESTLASMTLRPDTWYFYECTHDGDGTYTASRWPANESRPATPQLTVSGDVLSDGAGVHLYTGPEQVYDHAFVEWRVGGAGGGSDGALSVTVTASETTIPEGSAVTFEADATGEPASYEWGGAASGTGPETTETFGSIGEYTVTVTVTDDTGATATDSLTVLVVPDSIQPA